VEIRSNKMEIVKKWYSSHIPTTVHVDWIDEEMVIDVEQIEIVNGLMRGRAYCDRREVEVELGHFDCKRALDIYKEETESLDYIHGE
jgi:hypothetical protein